MNNNIKIMQADMLTSGNIIYNEAIKQYPATEATALTIVLLCQVASKQYNYLLTIKDVITILLLDDFTTPDAIQVAYRRVLDKMKLHNNNFMSTAFKKRSLNTLCQLVKKEL